MPNYQRYPSMSGSHADLVRRVGNLESDQTLLARIAALEKLFPWQWITAAVQGNGVDANNQPLLIPGGSVQMAGNGGVLSAAASGKPGWSNQGVISSFAGIATAYLKSMTAGDCNLYVEVLMPVSGDNYIETSISLNCADETFDPYSGRPAVRGYRLILAASGYTTVDHYYVNAIGKKYGYANAYVTAEESSWLNVGSYVPFTFPAADQWLAVRMRVAAGVVSTKLWAKTDPEPADWQWSASMMLPASGDLNSDGYPSDPAFHTLWPAPLPAGRLQLTSYNYGYTTVETPVTFANLAIT